MICSTGIVGGGNVIPADCFAGAGALGAAAGVLAAGFVEAVLTGGGTGRIGPDVCAFAPAININTQTKLAATPNIPKRTRRNLKLIKLNFPLVPSIMIFPVQSSAIELEYSFA